MYAFWGSIASNAVVATILAIGVMLLGRIWKNAAAVHALWVVVLLKLFTPPLITAELPIAFRLVPPAESADPRKTTSSSPVRDEVQPTAPVAATHSRGAIAAGNPQRALGRRSTEKAGLRPWSLSAVLAAIWIGGGCCTGLAHAARIRSFATVIRESEAAPATIRTMVTELSSRLGVKRVPDVLMTSRALPPLVWSLGLFPRVILPSELLARLSPDAQRTILAHELFHIRRGDDLVRLLELAAKTVFWWHPVVWWASRQLRELEEQCCDGRVLELIPDQPRTYAAALVDTLEFLSEQPCRLVPLRTAIDPAGSLSRRIVLLTQRRPNRLNLLSAMLVAGLAALPLALAFAIDPQQAREPAPKGEPSAGAHTAILRGRVTNEAGAPLAGVRVLVAIPAMDMRFVDAGAERGFVRGYRDHKPHKLLEARSDAAGDYRLEIPGIASRTPVSIDGIKPGYRRLAGLSMSRVDPRIVDVAPGETAEASLILTPALHLAGIVVDEHGKPIPAVKIWANEAHGTAGAGVETTATRSDGSFELFNYPATPRVIQNEKTRGFVGFSHPDFVAQGIEDIYAITLEQREALRIVLERGHIVTGAVIDVTGRPVPNAVVKVDRQNGNFSYRATKTDANGKFALRGLSKGVTMLYARALDIKQTVHMQIADDGDQNDLQVRLKPISFPADLKRYAVLGMQLADVTPELKSAYDLYRDDGVVILDPGNDPDRPRTVTDRRFAEGCHFWIVGQKRIGNVREFVDQILTEAIGEDAAKNAVHGVRVVYKFLTVDEDTAGDGNMTDFLMLTKDDLKQLQVVSDQLALEPQ